MEIVLVDIMTSIKVVIPMGTYADGSSNLLQNLCCTG